MEIALKVLLYLGGIGIAMFIGYLIGTTQRRQEVKTILRRLDQAVPNELKALDVVLARLRQNNRA
jgi:hypothetical protein